MVPTTLWYCGYNKTGDTDTSLAGTGMSPLLSPPKLHLPQIIPCWKVCSQLASSHDLHYTSDSKTGKANGQQWVCRQTQAWKKKSHFSILQGDTYGTQNKPLVPKLH